MTRRVTFSAAKADWLPGLSRAENRALFGPDAGPEPYGHNYLLDVMVAGDILPQTGIIVNIKEIDRIVKAHIVQVFDRKFINRQVPEFCAQPVTMENLLRFMRDALPPRLPPSVRLAGLRLEETPERYAEWSEKAQPSGSQEQMTMQTTHLYDFAASHRLHSPYLDAEANRELFGKCNYEHGHGHNYLLEITVSGPVDARTGRVMAADALDAIVNREIIERYDHRHLNHDIPELQGKIPSSEMLTQAIWDRLVGLIPPPARLHRVLIRETARNFFETTGPHQRAEWRATE